MLVSNHTTAAASRRRSEIDVLRPESNVPGAMIVHLNVGGQYFTTTRSTLCSVPDSRLAHHFDEHGPWAGLSSSDVPFIDRDPSMFGYILDFLRTGSVFSVPCDAAVLLRLRAEARHFLVWDGPKGLGEALHRRFRTALPAFKAQGTPVELLADLGWYTLQDLRSGGFSAEDLFRGGATICELRSLGYSKAEVAQALKACRIPVAHIAKEPAHDLEPRDLWEAGAYSLRELWPWLAVGLPGIADPAVARYEPTDPETGAASLVRHQSPGVQRSIVARWPYRRFVQEGDGAKQVPTEQDVLFTCWAADEAPHDFEPLAAQNVPPEFRTLLADDTLFYLWAASRAPIESGVDEVYNPAAGRAVQQGAGVPVARVFPSDGPEYKMKTVLGHPLNLAPRLPGLSMLDTSALRLLRWNEMQDGAGSEPRRTRAAG